MPMLFKLVIFIHFHGTDVTETNEVNAAVCETEYHCSVFKDLSICFFVEHSHAAQTGIQHIKVCTIMMHY